MEALRSQLRAIFEGISERIDVLNHERRRDGAPPIPRAQVQLLGQISLFCRESVSAILTLAQTGDLDAHLVMENVVKEMLKRELATIGMIYDEDSSLIWIAPGSQFDVLFEFKNVVVQAIDAESALVSKAVKAPEKNRILIREAIACGRFINLAERIVENGGRMENFI